MEQILLLGGGPLSLELAKELSKNWKVIIFSCKRQLDEPVDGNGKRFEAALKENNLPYFCADDINNDNNFINKITPKTLAIGMGEQWTFTKQTLDKFDGKLVDFMGIRLPQFRGGAHYSWQILQGNRIGCCNIQTVNEDMIPGVFDSGSILKRKEYFFSPSARIPMDYFKEAGMQELSFLLEFIAEIKAGKDFEPVGLEESFSLYMPRLHTKMHGFVNWNWETRDIERFICAFDDPYAGASTYIDGKLVRVKNCHSEFIDGLFHPFQCGLIYRIRGTSIYVATRDGTIVIQKVLDESGKILTDLQVGQRLFTPAKYLEDAMLSKASYSTTGLIQEKSKRG
jgi:methionyl-tRNA formyltransferase